MAPPTPDKLLSSKLRLLGLIVLSVAIGLALVVPRLAHQPEPAGPNPNGIDDFLQATRLLSRPPADLEATEELRSFVGRNHAALVLVRTGLTKECRVPVSYDQNYVPTRMNLLSRLKALAYALRVEGRLAENDGRFGEAAKTYAQVVAFGQEAFRGGVMIDGLVGNACVAIGLKALIAIRTNLNSRECRELAASLERIEDHWDGASAFLKQERRWSVGAAGWRYPFFLVRDFRSSWLHRRDFRDAMDMQLALLRLLRIDLAIRCYQVERGTLSKELAVLTPEYLRLTPLDPFSDKPFLYTPQNSKYLLYSVGHDRNDDAGMPAGRASNRNAVGDILLDTAF